MMVYTYSNARQNLLSLLEESIREGEVRIKRKDGRVFILRPEKKRGSPLDIEGIDSDLTSEEIVQFIKEGRRPESDGH
ncbi:MAG: type II toxin-antitoxin system Phd/YefM family antitoxin [Candidatus Aminicenantes bacterium]|nr:type II toxin-antitoxin system Phd/YefM family antitoxin [Candidatus Aminicenantes bacterium]